MLTIRTTISLPVHVHKKLKKDALEEGKSLNGLLLERILKEEKVDVKKTIQEIKKLTKGISFKGINYRELTHYGHKY